jgi:PAS domain-containing protein
LVEVVNLEKKQFDGDGPFSQEERDLLNMIAEMIRVSLARKHEAEELKKSEANLHAIFDTTDTIYVLLDNNFRIISYNQPAIDFTKKELNRNIVELKDDFMSHFSPDRQPVLSEWLKKVSSGDYVMYEQPYSNADYGINWYNVKMFPITGSEERYLD